VTININANADEQVTSTPAFRLTRTCRLFQIKSNQMCLIQTARSM